MAGELAVPGARRPWQAVIRYLLGAAVGVLVVLLLLPKRSGLVAAWHQLGTADLRWVAAAIGAEGLSLLTFAWLQQRVLRLSGAIVALPGLFALSLANEAIANSVPGEPVVSSAYRYRYYRRCGASGASAGWTIFTILIAQAIGMSLLLLLGVVVALAGSTSATGAGVTIVGLLIVAGAGAILIRRDVVLRLAGALMRLVRKVTGYPRGNIGARIDTTLARMREIPLSRRSTAGIVAIATAVWCSDFLCLLCGFRAVHTAIPWHGVLLAYGVAQVAGSFPVVPGGLGIVEGSLAVVLAAYGAGRVGAVSAALAFRLVNFWLALAVGWVSVALIAQHMRCRMPARAADGAGRPSGVSPAGPASAQSGE
ncbi:MAG TPA: lysylphosphatidylglycerol synthase transmembrane domain-containing protein [Streptosporangiaceae bacterium]|nr:lysylphosphatidylglycerol synthase transmembrane domain-containing protein [Streptosporangiaceae bacterium]